MDYPGLNGYEIARRFRAEPDADEVMLVALTGYGTPEARERSRQAGFDHHLIKPVNPEVLQEIMQGDAFIAGGGGAGEAVAGSVTAAVAGCAGSGAATATGRG